LLYALHRLLQASSGGRARVIAYGFYAQPLGEGSLASVSDDAQTVIGTAHAGDTVVSSFPRPAEVNARRFSDGAACFVAYIKGQFGGHIWISRRYYDEDEVRCRYMLVDPERCVWDFDVYVEPRLRLGRTFARLWKAVDARLASEGARWSFSRISVFNAASIRTHRRLGAVPIGSAVFVVLGPMQWAALSAPPYFHVSLSPRSRPQVRLSAPRPPGSSAVATRM
jgi:hypothetical protein